MPARKRKTKKRKPDLQHLFVIIVGFVFAGFGLLLLITPANYPIGNFPTAFNPLVGIVLIAIGLAILLGTD